MIDENGQTKAIIRSPGVFFAGNLDVAVRSSPPLAAETVVDNLRLRVPGYDQLLSALGCGDVGDRLEVVFGLCEVASSLDVEDLIGWQCRKAATLETVELWWGPAGDRKRATLSWVQS